jgi:hypothetical protein
LKGKKRANVVALFVPCIVFFLEMQHNIRKPAGLRAAIDGLLAHSQPDTVLQSLHAITDWTLLGEFVNVDC